MGGTTDDIDFTPLRLSRVQQAVLRVVLRGDGRTSADLGRLGLVGVSPATLHTAVAGLVQLGLVHVGTGRPAPVVPGDVDRALAAIERRRRQEADRELAALAATAAALRASVPPARRVKSDHRLAPSGLQELERLDALRSCERQLDLVVATDRGPSHLPPPAQLATLTRRARSVRILFGGPPTSWTPAYVDIGARVRAGQALTPDVRGVRRATRRGAAADPGSPALRVDARPGGGRRAGAAVRLAVGRRCARATLTEAGRTEAGRLDWVARRPRSRSETLARSLDSRR